MTEFHREVFSLPSRLRLGRNRKSNKPSINNRVSVQTFWLKNGIDELTAWNKAVNTGEALGLNAWLAPTSPVNKNLALNEAVMILAWSHQTTWLGNSPAHQTGS